MTAADYHPSISWYTLNAYHSWTQNYGAGLREPSIPLSRKPCTPKSQKMCAQTRILQQNRQRKINYLSNSLQICCSGTFTMIRNTTTGNGTAAKKEIDRYFTKGQDLLTGCYIEMAPCCIICLENLSFTNPWRHQPTRIFLGTSIAANHSSHLLRRASSWSYVAWRGSICTRVRARALHVH